MALFISLSSPLALAIVGLRGAEWCNFSARATATVIRSCRNKRSRRSLLRLAAEVPESRATKAIVTPLGFRTQVFAGCCGCCWALLEFARDMSTPRKLRLLTRSSGVQKVVVIIITETR